MLPQYILEVQLNIRKRIQDNEYQNVLAEICLQVKWCSKAQNTCSMVLSPLSFFVASYLNAALFFVLGNSFTVILNLWRVFFHIIRTAISPFYCIISPTHANWVQICWCVLWSIIQIMQNLKISDVNQWLNTLFINLFFVYIGDNMLWYHFI